MTAVKRFVPLDVLRGITIALMCMANNPGTWKHVFSPLRHSPWTGCTLADMIYPTFVFCMGCAMAFSFRKYAQGGAGAYLKVLRRGLLIFLVGLALNCFPFFPTEPHDASWSFGQNYLWWLGHRRIFGILQRIGLSYILAGWIVLWLRKPGRICFAIAALSVVYTGLLLIFGKDPGAFTLEGNVSLRIDEWLVGADHCYHGYNGTNFDPEGLFGSLSTACTALLGYLAGHIVISGGKSAAATSEAVARLFFCACCCLLGAMVLSIWIPIGKPLWTTSYVFYAGGWSMMALAFLSYLTDLKGITKPFTPFKAMGMNALMAFVCSGLIAKTLRLTGFSASEHFGANEFTSLAYALLFTLVIFCIQWILYKKKVIIKL